jgi:hypothetical protein
MRVRYRALTFITVADRLELELLYLNIVWTHDAYDRHWETNSVRAALCSGGLVCVRSLWVMDVAIVFNVNRCDKEKARVTKRRLYQRQGRGCED